MNKAQTSRKMKPCDDVSASYKRVAVPEYHMPVLKVGEIKEGEILVPMSSFYLEGLGATDEEIDAAAQPGKCIIVNGQKWLVDVKLKSGSK